jgi:hypothetical protein
LISENDELKANLEKLSKMNSNEENKFRIEFDEIAKKNMDYLNLFEKLKDFILNEEKKRGKLN